MIRSSINWFLEQHSFILVPSSTTELSGDLGYRGICKIDKNNILNETLNIIFYTDNNYYIYHDININYYLFLLNGKITNPIYSSNYVSINNSIFFINFNLNGYLPGDRIIISNNLTNDKITTKIINIIDNSFIIEDNIPWYNINMRLKITNYEGELYSIFESKNAKNPKSNKIKFGCKVNY